MAEYKQSNGETASWRLKQLYIVDWMVPATWMTVVILELIHTSKPDFDEKNDLEKRFRNSGTAAGLMPKLYETLARKLPNVT